MGDSIRIESISQLHELIGYEKPNHPLITLIDLRKIAPAISTLDLHIITNFYTISLKEGNSCRNKYGRQYYDFQEGSLTFIIISYEYLVETLLGVVVIMANYKHLQVILFVIKGYSIKQRVTLAFQKKSK